MQIGSQRSEEQWRDSMYKGEFIQSLRHGRGVEVKVVDRDQWQRYDGYWVNGLKHGRGRLV